MSPIEATLAMAAALAVVIGIFLYAVLALGWRELHEQARRRLGRMLARHGVSAGPSGYQGAAATGRCAACNNTVECDEWMRSGNREGSERFCPNAGLIARMKQIT